MTRRTIDREAVAKSLRELEILFGKKPPPKNEIAQRELGEVGTQESKLPAQYTTKKGGAT